MDNKLINYQGAEYLTDLIWLDFSASSQSGIQNKIKDTIKRKKYDSFGVKIDKSKTDRQIGFAKKEYKGINVLAKFFINQQQFFNSLILLKISDTEFWICNISNGKIDKELIVDETLIEETINTIIDFASGDSSDALNLFIPSEDYSFFETEYNDFLSSLEVDIVDFDINEVLSDNTNCKIDLVYNATTDMIKQGGILVIAVLIGFVGYQKIYKENPLYDSIQNQEDSFVFSQNNIKYNNYVKKSEKEDLSSFILKAKEQLIVNHNISYSNKEIVDIMKKLYKDFPLYSVEWKLTDINYINNGHEFFRISYKRIPNSFGFINSLKKEIKEVLKDNGYKDFTISVPSTKGDVVYIDFNFKEKKKININKDITEKTKNIVKNIDKKIKETVSSIETIESNAITLSFFDKRFGDALENLQSEIQDEVARGNSLIKKAEKQRELLKVKDIKIDESIIQGSQSDMLNMQQSYSFYKWDEQSRPTYYPILDRQTENKYKNIKYYAQSFDFSVNVGSNANVIGFEGLSGIMENTSLLNQPYIIIKEVSFNLDKEIWEVEGSYYEKLNK